MDNEQYRLNNCRICHTKVIEFLNLGATHPPEEFRTKEELGKPIITYPLGLSYCPECGEVQLSHEIPPDIMYKQNYFYDYSNTKTGEKHWTEYAQLIYKKFNLKENDLVVDIGSNAGKLLDIFRGMGLKIQGVDPSPKLVKIARERNIPTIEDYFSPAVASEIVKKDGKASVITCNNVFDHVTDLYDYMKGITTLLKEDGVFIAEVPYFGTFFQTHNHVVYHQQIDYLLVKPFMKLFEANGMEFIDCEKVDYHGGSIRMFIAFKDKHKVSEHVQQFVKEEDELFKDRKKALDSFAKALLEQRDELTSTVKKLKAEGKTIGAVGMSAKGNVLMFYSGIGPESIDFVTDKSELKQGRYTPSGIPIVKEEELITRNPDYALLLAWNFKGELFDTFADYIKSGGKFFVPIPKMKFVE
jgi:SAM-dependent methyltransferase